MKRCTTWTIKTFSRINGRRQKRSLYWAMMARSSKCVRAFCKWCHLHNRSIILSGRKVNERRRCVELRCRSLGAVHSWSGKFSRIIRIILWEVLFTCAIIFRIHMLIFEDSNFSTNLLKRICDLTIRQRSFLQRFLESDWNLFLYEYLRFISRCGHAGCWNLPIGRLSLNYLIFLMIFASMVKKMINCWSLSQYFLNRVFLICVVPHFYVKTLQSKNVQGLLPQRLTCMSARNNVINVTTGNGTVDCYSLARVEWKYSVHNIEGSTKISTFLCLKQLKTCLRCFSKSFF